MPEEDFELYLSLLKKFLRISAAQGESIAAELRDHLEYRLAELEARGLPREAAIREALDEFGDANELARHFTSLARTRKRRLIMRLTMSSVAVLAGLLLVATAFWPETPHAPAPQVARAQALPAAKAAEAKPPEPSQPARRIVRLNHAPSTSLAQSLNQHFGSDAGIQIVSEPVSNSLLLKAPRQLIDEAQATIEELDHATASATFDVTIIELALASGTGKGLAQPVDPRELEGPTESARAKVQELVKSGHAHRFKRVHLQALNNQLTQSEDSEERSEGAAEAIAPSTPATPPAATTPPATEAPTPPGRRGPGTGLIPATGNPPARGASTAPGRGAAAAAGTLFPRGPQGTSRPRVGTIVQLTARVGDDRWVTASMVIRDSPRLIAAAETPDAPFGSGLDSNFIGTVSLLPGRAMVVNSIERSTANGRSQTLFIVSTDIVETSK